MNDQRRIKMATIFKRHTDVKELHVTADDTAFFQPGDAKNHGNTLENKEVDVVKRSDVIKVGSPQTEDASKEQKAKAEKQKAESTGGNDERTDLFAKLEALGGTAPKNIGTEKLKEKVAGLEAEKAKGAGDDNSEGAGE